MDQLDVLDIVERKGEIGVTMRKRDSRLLALCIDMRRRGLLSGGRRLGNNFVFKKGEAFDAQAERQVRPMAGD